METQSSPQAFVQCKPYPPHPHSSQHSDHRLGLKFEARSLNKIAVFVEWLRRMGTKSSKVIVVNLILSTASIAEQVLTHGQLHVLTIKLVVKFGVFVVIVIMPVISKSGRGQALRTTS
jgi:hypothetical protein